MVDKEKMVTEVVLAAAQGGTVIQIMEKAGECFDAGRRAGIEEAADIAKTMHDSGEYCFICTAEYEVKIRELLEAKP